MVECGLCGMVFDDDDQRIEERKERHEEYHSDIMGKNRDSRYYKTSYNYVRNVQHGKVTWLSSKNFK